MPNITLNRLEVTAPSWEVLLTLIGELDVPQVCGSDKTFKIIDGFFVCVYPFDSAWFPPIEVYETLEKRAKELDGVKLYATWYDEAEEYDTRYRWLFDGKKYQVEETGLNQRMNAYMLEHGPDNSRPIVGTILDYDYRGRR